MPSVPATTSKSNGAASCLCISDCHFSHKPPIARSAEDDWFAAQRRPLEQLKALQKEHNGAPIVCAGDFLDTWRVSHELVNFLLQVMPHVYSVIGNHDAPAHNLDDMHRSAFWTLVKAGRITVIEKGKPIGLGPITLHGFSCGQEIKPLVMASGLSLNVAVVHEYVWSQSLGTGYMNAPDNNRYSSFVKKAQGYDICIVGDNHKGFLIEKEGKPTVCNVGSLMRRKTDEVDSKPCVALIYDSGKVVRHYLDCSQDKFLDSEALAKAVTSDLSSFSEVVAELNQLQDSALDFLAALKQFASDNKVPKTVRDIILQAAEGSAK